MIPRTGAVALLLLASTAHAQVSEWALPTPPPELAPPKAVVTAELLKQVVAAVQPQIEACYGVWSSSTRWAGGGTLKAALTVTAGGLVKDAAIDARRSTLGAEALHACAVRALSCLVLPPLSDSLDHSIEWTFRWAARAADPGGPPEPLPSLGEASPERFKYRDTVPPGFHLVSEPRAGLIGGGVAAFVGGYGVTLAISLAVGKWGGAVPLVGPILFAGQVLAPFGPLEAVLASLVVTLAVVELAVQVTGLVMIAVGAGSPKRWLERDVTRPRITILPGAAGAPLGASVVGRF